VNRLHQLLDAVRSSLVAIAPPPFRDVRIELDRFGLDDLLAASARSPFARVCQAAVTPRRREGGGFDVDVTIAIVVVAGRSGRPGGTISSADSHCLDLMLAVAGRVQADPWFGLAGLTQADIPGMTVAVSDEASGSHGVAIGVVEIRVTLLDMLPPGSAAARQMTDEAAGVPFEAVANGTDPFEVAA
jgi:hypothetical protein